MLLLLRNASGRAAAPFVPPRLEPRLVREARIMLAVYAAVAALSVAAGSDAALFYWVVPAILGQPFLRAYLLAEHTGLPFVERFLGEHAHDADRLARALPRLEHAVPRRAPRQSRRAVPRLAGAASRASGRS